MVVKKRAKEKNPRRKRPGKERSSKTLSIFRRAQEGEEGDKLSGDAV